MYKVIINFALSGNSTVFMSMADALRYYAECVDNAHMYDEDVFSITYSETDTIRLVYRPENCYA
jgi:hypothetical protein